MKQGIKDIPRLHAETASLCQSPIACAVSDAWLSLPQYLTNAARVTGAWAPFAAAVDQLEAATRGSALRKVRP